MRTTKHNPAPWRNPRLLLAAVPLLLCGVASQAVGEVIVHLKNGRKLTAEAVVQDGEAGVELKICHSHHRTIPKALINKLEVFEPALGEVKSKPQAPAAAPETPAWAAKREKWIAEFFDATDAVGREKVLDSVRQGDALRQEDVEKYRTAIFAATMKGLSLREGDCKFDHPQYKGKVHVELHPKREATTAPTTQPGLKYALVVLLHGGGEGAGDWRSGADLFIGPFKIELGRVVFLCPNVLEKRYAEWGANPNEEAYVKELINAAKRTWPIDTDRIYCAGYSMGGYGTWHYGGHQADTFAGLISGAGGILLGTGRGETWGWGVLTNLKHTPIFFGHAKDDVPSPVWSDQESDKILGELGKLTQGTYPRKYVEYEKGGHNAPVKGMKDGVTWVSAFKRPANPKAIAWEPSREFIPQFYWLRTQKPKFFTRIEATIEGNTIDLRLTGISDGFSIMLNEQLVDMTKPVRVNCGGKVVFEGVVTPSLSAMLESITDKIDPAMWHWGRIDF